MPLDVVDSASERSTWICPTCGDLAPATYIARQDRRDVLECGCDCHGDEAPVYHPMEPRDPVPESPNS